MKTLLAVLSLIPGLRATPPLPPRTVDTSLYNDFEATLVEKYADNNDRYANGTCYIVNIKNTGEGYIKDIHFKFNQGYYSYETELQDSISPYCVIGPNQEATFVVSANRDADSLDDFEIYAQAYTAFTDELTVTGSKTIEITSDYRDYYSYRVDMSFGHTVRDKYCYGAIVKAYAEEKEMYLILDEWYNFSFGSAKEIKGNENNEVEVVKTLKTEYIGYEQEKFQSNFSYRVKKGCFGSVLFGIPAAASLGLITTFVVALRRSIKKNKSK